MVATQHASHSCVRDHPGSESSTLEIFRFLHRKIFVHAQSSRLRSHVPLLDEIIANFRIDLSIKTHSASLPEREVVEIDPTLEALCIFKATDCFCVSTMATAGAFPSLCNVQ
jgi:hypothetical protein